MSRLSDDEKRVFTDRIAELEEYRHLYHLECTKVMSREAIIEQLSETELAKDVTRLEACDLCDNKAEYRQCQVCMNDKLIGSHTDEDWTKLQEENTLLAEHNQALQKIERLAKLVVEHGEPELIDELDALLKEQEQ